MANSKLKVVKDYVITKNVLEALKLASNKKEELIHRLTPKIFHALGKIFAAIEGSSTYNKFALREVEYLLYIMNK